jgi:uncharacterized protein YcbK (DUF882 family)
MKGGQMEYFTDSEFACKCGCDKMEMNALVKYKLDRARAMAGIPFVITSGLRCVEHNRKVGGSPTSSHLLGLAVDIATEMGTDRYLIIKALMHMGFTRIGIAKDFIHVDADTNKPDNVWLY